MWIEIFGVVTGILFVILEVRQSHWLWPLGILTSATYIWVFLSGKFYADMGLQVYYVLISVYGWYFWLRGGQRSTGGTQEKRSGSTEEGSTGTDTVSGLSLLVRRVGQKEALQLFAVFLAAWVGLYFLLDRLTDSPVPLGDSFTTALAVVATWMLTRKILEQWWLWVLANAVSMALYLHKGLYPTVLLYAVYTGMAIYGYIEWKKSMQKAEDA